MNSDLRLDETARSAIKVHPGQPPPGAHPQVAGVQAPQLQQQFAGQQQVTGNQPRTTVTLAVNSNNKSPKSQSRAQQQQSLPQSQPLGHSSPPQPHPQLRQTVTVHPPPITAVTVTHIGYQGQARQNAPPPHSNGQPQRHHLPDSPPDSGSEPPFSPLNDEKLVNSVNSVPSAANPSDIMLGQTVDSMKQFINYNSLNQSLNQIPLKQLLPSNETSLTITPPHHSVSHHCSHHCPSLTSPLTPRQPQAISQLPPLHSHPVTLIPQEVTPINQMVPIPGPIGVQATPAPPGMVSPASGHLTTLYSTSDDYLAACECISSPEQHSQAQPSQQPNKKRKVSGKQSTNNANMMNGGVVHIKQEPDGLSPEPNTSNNPLHTTTSMIVPGDEEYFEYGPDGQVYLDSVYQCIRFQLFQQNPFSILCDATLKEL